MRIAAFTTLNGEHSWGVLDESNTSILSAADLEEAYFTFLPETINELIEQGEDGRLALASALQKHKEDPIAVPYDLKDALITQPLDVKKNIFCLGLNYPTHLMEFEKNLEAPTPEAPRYFSKLPTSVIGPNQEINPHLEATKELDYEGELAIIIGKRGSHISASEAWDYIFGYTIINDVTARDLQKRHVNWLKGKSLDTFCPMGPAILIGEQQEQHFTITTKVNGEIRQSGSTQDMIFSIPEIIEDLSNGITLEPGDIIATGTPFGVGMGFNPPRFLQSEDEISITISEIGTLTNTVR